MSPVSLNLQVVDSNNELRVFELGAPVPAGREILTDPVVRSSNAFNLPVLKTETVEFEGQFIGDVNRGGPCNVDLISYVPHNVTHIETSAHILSPDSGPITVNQIPQGHLSGIVYVIDLTHLTAQPGRLISWEDIEQKLIKNGLPITMLALKTRSSLLPEDFDFSNQNFMALSQDAARGIHDYLFNSEMPESRRTRIDCLILDLPSIDPEADEGLLLAHRAFFGLPETGHIAVDTEKRALIELAMLNNIEEGYYFAGITPPRIQTNAVSTGLTLRPLNESDNIAKK